MKTLILFGIFLLFFIPLITASFGYSNPTLPKINSPTSTATTTNIYNNLSSNSSTWWNNMNSINTTQMENNGGVLNILVSWLTSLFYTKTKIDSFNSTWSSTYNATYDNYGNLINNSWNESYADGKYAQYNFIDNTFNGSGNFKTTGRIKIHPDLIDVESSSYPITIGTQDTLGMLFISSDVTNQYAPDFRFHRDINSDLTNYLGVFNFDGNNNGGVEVTYSRLGGEIFNNVANNESGKFVISVMSDGALNPALTLIKNNSIQLNGYVENGFVKTSNSNGTLIIDNSVLTQINYTNIAMLNQSNIFNGNTTLNNSGLTVTNASGTPLLNISSAGIITKTDPTDLSIISIGETTNGKIFTKDLTLGTPISITPYFSYNDSGKPTTTIQRIMSIGVQENRRLNNLNTISTAYDHWRVASFDIALNGFFNLTGIAGASGGSTISSFVNTLADSRNFSRGIIDTRMADNSALYYPKLSGASLIYNGYGFRNWVRVAPILENSTGKLAMNTYGYWGSVEGAQNSSVTQAFGIYSNVQGFNSSSWNIYANGTFPNYFGGSVQIAGNTTIFDDGTNTNFITNRSGGSGLAWFSNNVSATGYITRTSVYDKSKGSALNQIKDASAYINPDGSINHEAFYGEVKFPVVDYSKPVNVKYIESDCKDVLDENGSQIANDDGTIKQICTDTEKTKITYPYTKQESGVELGMEIDVLRQGTWELNQIIKEQNTIINELINKINKLCEVNKGVC